MRCRLIPEPNSNYNKNDREREPNSASFPTRRMPSCRTTLLNCKHYNTDKKAKAREAKTWYRGLPSNACLFGFSKPSVQKNLHTVDHNAQVPKRQRDDLPTICLDHERHQKSLPLSCESSKLTPKANDRSTRRGVDVPLFVVYCYLLGVQKTGIPVITKASLRP